MTMTLREALEQAADEAHESDVEGGVHWAVAFEAELERLGYAVVPISPTREMKRAGAAYQWPVVGRRLPPADDMAAGVYAAAIAARPRVAKEALQNG